MVWRVLVSPPLFLFFSFFLCLARCSAFLALISALISSSRVGSLFGVFRWRLRLALLFSFFFPVSRNKSLGFFGKESEEKEEE